MCRFYFQNRNDFMGDNSFHDPAAFHGLVSLFPVVLVIFGTPALETVMFRTGASDRLRNDRKACGSYKK